MLKLAASNDLEDLIKHSKGISCHINGPEKLNQVGSTLSRGMFMVHSKDGLQRSMIHYWWTHLSDISSLKLFDILHEDLKYAKESLKRVQQMIRNEL